jgi:hypothetical protein
MDPFRLSYTRNVRLNGVIKTDIVENAALFAEHEVSRWRDGHIVQVHAWRHEAHGHQTFRL